MSRRATLLDSRLTKLMAKNDNANNAVQDDQVLPKTLLQKFWLNSVPIIGLGEDSKKAKVKQAENEDEQMSKRKGKNTDISVTPNKIQPSHNLPAPKNLPSTPNPTPTTCQEKFLRNSHKPVVSKLD